MNTKQIKYLEEEHDITIVCQSPLEIEHIHKNDGVIGTATGTIASSLLKLLWDSRLNLGQYVYHKDIYDGNERMKIVGDIIDELGQRKLILEGDYSGGTNNVIQQDTYSLQGIIVKSDTTIIENLT